MQVIPSKNKSVCTGLVLILIVSILQINVLIYTRNYMDIEQTTTRQESHALSYALHDPFNITSDDDFVTQSWPGEGTSEEPYIIDGLNITTASVPSILIQNTTKHFIIRNCWFVATEVLWGTGLINMTDVANGHIEGNWFAQGHTAISIQGCTNCTYGYNFFNTTVLGILAYDAEYCEFFENQLVDEDTAYPLHIQSGEHLVIWNNTFLECRYEGIGITECNDTQIVENTLQGGQTYLGQYGLLIRNSSKCEMSQNTLSSFDSSIEIVYGSNHLITENTISECYGGVRVRSDGAYIAHNNISCEGYGVDLRVAQRCVVDSNDLEGTTSTTNGLEINVGRDSIVSNNKIHSNEIGIRIQGTINASIIGNLIYDNLIGISLLEEGYYDLYDGYPINCTITENVFQGCTFSFDITSPEGLNHRIEHNTVNGRLLGYYYNLSSAPIDGELYGEIVLAACNQVSIEGGQLCGITLMFCEDCEVTDVKVTDAINAIYLRYSTRCIVGFSETMRNENGIRIEYSSHCTIFRTKTYENNYGFVFDSTPYSTIYDCETYGNDFGIVLIGSHNNNIEHNYIHNNIEGIYVVRTSSAYIANNEIMENEGRGILLNSASSDNKIISNTFGWNSINAVCTGLDNEWDDGSQHGNRWSDYDGTGVYMIDDDDIDRFPERIDDNSSIPSQTNTTTTKAGILGDVTPEIAIATALSLFALVVLAIVLSRKKKAI